MATFSRPRDVIAATLTAAGVLGAIALVVALRGVFIAFFVAVLLSMALRPIVSRLERRVGGRLAAALLVHCALVVVLIGFAVAVLPLVVDQVSSLWRSLPDVYATLRTRMLETGGTWLPRLAGALPPRLDLSFGEPLLGSVPQALNWVGAWLGALAAGLLVGAAILVMSFSWSVQGERTVRSLLLFIPLDRRSDVADTAGLAADKLAAFVRGQLLLCASVGGLAFLAYVIIGLPNALALGLMAGLLEVVPLIGPALGAVPAGLVALSMDPTLAIWVVAATAVIQLVENYLLVPRVMDRSVGVNPIVTILAITAFGAAMGVVGALLAIPLAALAQLLLERYLLVFDSRMPQPPNGRDELSVLRYEVQHLVHDIRQQVRHDDEAGADELIEDELEGMVQDLDQILADEEAGRAPAEKAA